MEEYFNLKLIWELVSWGALIFLGLLWITMYLLMKANELYYKKFKNKRR